jgi:hypothetical protein
LSTDQLDLGIHPADEIAVGHVQIAAQRVHGHPRLVEEVRAAHRDLLVHVADEHSAVEVAARQRDAGPVHAAFVETEDVEIAGLRIHDVHRIAAIAPARGQGRHFAERGPRRAAISRIPVRLHCAVGAEPLGVVPAREQVGSEHGNRRLRLAQRPVAAGAARGVAGLVVHLNIGGQRDALDLLDGRRRGDARRGAPIQSIRRIVFEAVEPEARDHFGPEHASRRHLVAQHPQIGTGEHRARVTEGVGHER